MRTNNKYWGLGYTELEELQYEQIILVKDAKHRNDYASARRFERESKLILDAMAAYERGE